MLSTALTKNHRWLYALFFCSGFPALLYQIVWQRALFVIYGVNIQSVTVVVSVFMLGLGLGSLAGGEISKSRRLPLLVVFGLIEAGIGANGAVSLSIFHLAAQFTAGAQPLSTAIITFFLLLLPTILMGSTLPILVAYMVTLSGNVGRSVGALYCVNTLGSAVACFVAALSTMQFLGESGSVRLAATINAAIGLTAIAIHFKLHSHVGAATAVENPAVEIGARKATGAISISMPIALAVAGLCGFVALGYEILWYRGYSYSLAGRAPVFALVLGFYLIGIALGSLVSRALCSQKTVVSGPRFLALISLFVLTANVTAFLVLPGVSFLNRLRYGFGMPVIAVATAFLGATFPLICHAAVPADYRAGQGLSRLYLSNIIGSTLGSFIVGYILMDYWGIGDIDKGLGFLGLALAAMLLSATGLSLGGRAVGVGGCIALMLLLQILTPPLFRRIYERLGKRQDNYPRIVENRSGVIAVDQYNTVWGGGAYDGKFNTSLVNDTNGVFRPYAIGWLHPAPRRVLMIGLSSGSWAQIILNHPEVEELIVIEINPGYLQLIREHPDVSSILQNPKLTIVIDDGRRWLVRNRSERFDVIVQNTTWAWRAHTSNLLSVEYLRLIRSHLADGGVFLYNTTSSPEARLTGVSVYPYAVRIGSCLAVSDRPMRLNIERWQKLMLNYRINGNPIIDPLNPLHLKRLAEVRSVYETAPDAEALRRQNAGRNLITDDNMGVEWTEFKEYVAELIHHRLHGQEDAHPANP